MSTRKRTAPQPATEHAELRAVSYGSEPWEEKAHRLVTAECLAAWRRSNLLPGGKRRARHVPYSVPAGAARLVELLGLEDRRSAEQEAKSIFLGHAAAGGRFDP
jgi:hypothetical protein